MCPGLLQILRNRCFVPVGTVHAALVMLETLALLDTLVATAVEPLCFTLWGFDCVGFGHVRSHARFE